MRFRPAGGSICSRASVLALLATISVNADHGRSVRLDRVVVYGAPRSVEVRTGFAEGETIPYGQLDSCADRIRQQLADAGYLAAEVMVGLSGADSAAALECRVVPGARYRVGRWRVAGNDSFLEADIAARLPGRRSFLSRSVSQRALAGVLTFYEARGYPLAATALAGIAPVDDRAEPLLAIQQGPLVVVSDLVCSADLDLPLWLLRRAAGFRTGVRYSPARVAAWQRNLEESGMVWVERTHDVIALGDSAFAVGLSVRERRANQLAGAVGYAPGDAGPSGQLEFRSRNLLNTGRRLRVGWLAGGGRLTYDLGYTEPWLLGRWLLLTGAVHHEVTDTTRSQTRLESEGEWQLSPDLSVLISIGYDHTASLDTGERASATWAGSGVVVDRRTVYFLPRKGWRLALRSRAGQRNDATGGNLVAWFETDIEGHQPLPVRFVLAGAAHGRVVRSARALPDHDLYRLGGAGSLRGFHQDQFRAAALAWCSLELRYPIGDRLLAYPFADLGVVDKDAISVHSAYGVGFRTWTAVGQFHVDYGISDDRRNPLRGRVHLGYVAEF